MRLRKQQTVRLDCRWSAARWETGPRERTAGRKDASILRTRRVHGSGIRDGERAGFKRELKK